MSHELEAAAADSARGFLGSGSRRHAPPVGTPCANCGTPLRGPWCHLCGQSGEDFHRSTLKLCAEAVEGLFHLDGRLWRTVPDLLLRPGRLTRSFLDGHRAPQIPPLRLFLVVLLALFVIGALTPNSGLAVVELSRSHGTARATESIDQLTPVNKAKIIDRIRRSHMEIGSGKPNPTASAWLRDRMVRVVSEPQRFTLILEQWAERFAFLMLPVSALLLALLFVFQRQYLLFDHTIFSLHSLSALGLIVIAGMLVSALVGDWAFLILLAAPFHLWTHMRGVYRTGVVGTLARVFLLFVGSLFAALVLFVGLMAVGLNGMTG